MPWFFPLPHTPKKKNNNNNRHLKREYAIDGLPDISARPELLNLLHPKVQQICKSFPVQVSEGGG
jgi:hypothetical protein